jgi:hypothetical protein
MFLFILLFMLSLLKYFSILSSNLLFSLFTWFLINYKCFNMFWNDIENVYLSIFTCYAILFSFL